MARWHKDFPKEVNKWYRCRMEGVEVPLYLVHCSLKDTVKWVMDDGKSFVDIDEPVEWAEQIEYVPQFNRF